ncbi:MAG: DCC1-like thiol-disulfide oxidoreductase family protein, partial [Actinomycetota bacterium]
MLVHRLGEPDERIEVRSRAALGAALRLGGVWGFLARGALVLPSFVLDPLYRLVAKLRYRIFG